MPLPETFATQRKTLWRKHSFDVQPVIRPQAQPGPSEVQARKDRLQLCGCRQAAPRACLWASTLERAPGAAGFWPARGHPTGPGLRHGNPPGRDGRPAGSARARPPPGGGQGPRRRKGPGRVLGRARLNPAAGAGNSSALWEGRLPGEGSGAEAAGSQQYSPRNLSVYFLPHAAGKTGQEARNTFLFKGEGAR